ncbi:MAG: hypothetical protein MUC90_06275 [Thermoplasmata archaeon]|nr:hypothetical protein [Thermoplasmata archaeon]
MNPAIILLAAASIPMAAVSLYRYLEYRRPSSAAGVVGAGWSAAGVFLVSAGMPGLLLLPCLLAILLLGSMADLRHDRSRIVIVRTAVIVVLLVAVSAGLVVL